MHIAHCTIYVHFTLYNLPIYTVQCTYRNSTMPIWLPDNDYDSFRHPYYNEYKSCVSWWYGSTWFYFHSIIMITTYKIEFAKRELSEKYILIKLMWHINNFPIISFKIVLRRDHQFCWDIAVCCTVYNVNEYWTYGYIYNLHSTLYVVQLTQCTSHSSIYIDIRHSCTLLFPLSLSLSLSLSHCIHIAFLFLTRWTMFSST